MPAVKNSQPITKQNRKRGCLRGLLLFLALGFFMVGMWVWLGRPQRSPILAQELYSGVTYTRQIWDTPRPVVIHIIQVDLSTPGLSLLVTPSTLNGEMEYSARTTGEFAKEFEVKIAMNANYFDPFVTNSLWDFYPKSGDPVNALGLAISNGQTISPETYSPALCYQPAFANIQWNGCPEGTTQAVAGAPVFVLDGQVALWDSTVQAELTEPRSAVAVSADGLTLWMIVVDGRQNDYSEGLTLAELGDVVVALGGYSALNLDGGGSSTLVHNQWWGVQTLNAPIHTRIPTRQRPVANHLGILIQPP
jgi:hypothetical protein